MKKRILSFLMALVMCVQMLPVGAFAAVDDATNLCEHHTAHDETCNAGHECTAETGCVTRVENCTHVHDADCGFVAAVEGAPCGFVCAECAAPTTEPTTAPATVTHYIVAGVDSLCGSNWNGADLDNAMTQNGSVYTKTYENVATGRYELKVTTLVNESITAWHGAADGGNVCFDVTAACDVTVTFDPTTSEITVTGAHVEKSQFEIGDVYVAGDGSGSWLNGVSWNPADERNKMTEVEENIFEITFSNVAAGDYQFKFAHCGSWSYGWAAGGGNTLPVQSGTAYDAEFNGSGNFELTVPADGSTVTLQLDLTGGENNAKVTATVTSAHTHSWGGWASNETHHWKVCTAENCDITDNTQKEGYGEHDIDYDETGNCAQCGKHTHVWVAEWSRDDLQHWKKCVADDGVMGLFVPHNYVDGKCECGAEDPNYVAPTTPTYPTTVYFQDTKERGTVYAYAWNAASVSGGTTVDTIKNAEWPGVAMTRLDVDGYVYSYVIESPYDSVIFNGDGLHSGDLVVPTGNNTAYVNGAWTTPEESWVNAGGTQTPEKAIQSVRIAGNGSVSEKWLNGLDWKPAADENLMTEVSTDVYQIVYEDVPAGDYQFKFVANGSWNEPDWGGNFSDSDFGVEKVAAHKGSNITFSLTETTTLTLTLNLTNFNADTKEGATFTVTKGLPVEVAYTLSFNANAGEDQVTNLPGEVGCPEGASNATIDWNSVPKRTGYTFLGYARTADAAAPDYPYDAANPTPITFTIGEDTTLYAIWVQVPPHEEHNGVIFDTPWNIDLAGDQTLEADANIYLNADVTISGRLYINAGVTVNLCLNGYTLNLGSNYIGNKGTLNIYSCRNGGTIRADGIVNHQTGTLNLYSGTVETTSTRTQFTTIGNSGIMNMFGGQVIANDGRESTAIRNVSKGEGVGTLTIKGGTVTGSTQGYGIVDDVIAGNPTPKMYIEGGTITGDTAVGSTGDLHVSGGTLTGTMYGIRNSGTAFLSGDPAISGGTADICSAVRNDGTAPMLYGTATMDAGSDRYTGEKLSVYLVYYPEGQPVVYNATADKFAYVNSSNSFVQGTGDNANHLLLGGHAHGETTFDTKWYSDLGTETISGSANIALDNNIQFSGDLTIAENATVTICLAGKTLNMLSSKIVNNGNLTICDCTGKGKLTGAHDNSTIVNNGTLTVSSGTVENTGIDANCAIENNGTMTLTSGTVEFLSGADSSAAIANAADATLNIQGGNVKGKNGIDNLGTLKVSDGTINATAANGIYVQVYDDATGTAYISGGTITGAVYGIASEGNVYLSGNPVISGEADIYRDGNLYAAIGDKAYTGGELSLELPGALQKQDMIIVQNVTADNAALFTLAGASGTLTLSDGNLIYTTHNHDAVTFDEKLQGEIPDSLTTGSYILTGDAKIGSSGLTIPENVTVDLCLNGHTLTMYVGKEIEVQVGATLNIYDCSPAGNGQISCQGNAISVHGTLNLYSGTIACAGSQAISMASGSETRVNIYGGKVTASSQYAIRVAYDNQLHVYGGTISGGTADRDYNVAIHNSDGGVYLSGTPTLTGGRGAISMEGRDATIYAADEGTPYEGEKLALELVESFRNGAVLVQNVTAENKDKFALVNSGTKSLTWNAEAKTLNLAHHTHTVGGTETIFATELPSELPGDNYVLDSKNYVLAGETTARGMVTIPSGTTVNLCLNGHTLNMKINEIVVHDGGTLTICDCDGKGKINGTGIVVLNNGTLNVISGTLTSDGSALDKACAISNGAGGKVYLSGGAFNSNWKDAIYNSPGGELHISGGRVTGKEYGVKNYGTVYLSGTPFIASPIMAGSADAKLYAKDGESDYAGDVVRLATDSSVNYSSGDVVVYHVNDVNWDFFNLPGKALTPVTQANGTTNLVVAHSHDGVIYDTTWSGTVDTTEISTNANIVLTGDTTLTGSGMAFEADVNLCLNGHTLTVNATIVNYAKLTICNCQTTRGKLTSGCESGTLWNWGKSASTTITGVAVENTSGNYLACVIENVGGTVTLNNVAVNGPTGIENIAKTDIYIDAGTVNVNNDSNFFCSRNGIFNEGTLTVSGSYITAGEAGINSSGTVTVSGGYISGGTGIMNTGTLTVNSSEVEGVRDAAIDNDKGGTATINGGTITGDSGTADVRNGGKLTLTAAPALTKVHCGAGGVIDAASYTGAALSLTLDNPETRLGQVIVIGGAAKKDSFTLAGEYSLIPGGANNADLVLSYHLHADGTNFDTLWTGSTVSADIQADAKLVLTEDVTVSSQITIASGATVTLCLNGHTLDLGTAGIVNNGTLHICDCQATPGKITSAYLETLTNSGTLTVTGVTMENTYNGRGSGIQNNGRIATLKNATVTSMGGRAISNNQGSTLNVSDCILTGASDSEGIANGGTATIAGSTVTGKTGILSSGTLTVTSGTITGSATGIENLSNGTVNVQGGTVTGSQYGICSSANKGTVNVTGGNIEGRTGIATNRCSLAVSGGNISGNQGIVVGVQNISAEISGGTITGTQESIHNDAGVTVSGTASIIGGETGISNYATLNVSGGSITASGQPGRAIFQLAGTCTVSAGYVKGNHSGIYVSDGSCAISGGTVTCQGEFNQAVQIVKGSLTVSGSAVINGTSTGISCIGGSSKQVTVTGGKIQASYLAIHCDDGTVIRVSGGEIISGADAILTKHELYLSGNPQITGDISHEGGTIYATAEKELSSAPYAGSNLTLRTSSATLGQVIVYNGAQAKDKFTLRSTDCTLTPGTGSNIDHLILAPKPFTVTFHPNGGSGEAFTKDSEYTTANGIYVELPWVHENVFTREEYTLMGWSNDPNYTDVGIWSDHKVDENGKWFYRIINGERYVPVAGNTNVYAIWAKNVLDVDGDGKGDYPNLKYISDLEDTEMPSVIDVLADYDEGAGARGIVLGGKESITLNLKGHTITNCSIGIHRDTSNVTINGGGGTLDGQIMAFKSVTLTDLNLSQEIVNGGNLTVNSGTYHGLVLYSTATLNGGTFLPMSHYPEGDEYNGKSIIFSGNDAAEGALKAGLLAAQGPGKAYDLGPDNIVVDDVNRCAYYTETVTIVNDSIHSVKITKNPDKMVYTHGEKFDPTGMVVTATYKGGSTKDVTKDVTFYYSTDTLTAGQTTLALSYKEDSSLYAFNLNGLKVNKVQLNVSGVKWVIPDGLTYNGQPQSIGLSELPEGVTAQLAGNTETNAGTYTATATFALAEGYSSDNYEITGIPEGGMTKEWSIAKATPTADHFTFTKPENLTYTGQGKEASIGPATSYSGMGDVTVKYYQGGEVLSGAPTDVGTYTFRIDVTEGDNFIAAQDITADSWKFTITPAKLQVTVMQSGTQPYTGEAQAIGIYATGVSVNRRPITFLYSTSEDGNYSTNPPSFTDAGTYTVYYEASAENHETVRDSLQVTIKKATNGWIMEPSIFGWTYGETAAEPVGESIFGSVAFQYRASDADDWSKEKPTQAGKYMMQAAVIETVNWTGLTVEVPFTISKAALTIEHTGDLFTFTAPVNICDGEPKAATVTVKNGVTGVGSITVRYFKDGTELGGAPTAVGTYTVQIDVAEGINYNAADGLTAEGWTFTFDITDETEHTGVTLVSNGNGTHDKICSVCQKVIESGTACTGTTTDDCDKGYKCSCGGYFGTKEHDFSGDYLTDAEGHWHRCADCGATDTRVKHSGTDDGDCTTIVTCTNCGYAFIGAMDDHSYTDVHDASCNNPGCQHTRTMYTVTFQMNGHGTAPDAEILADGAAVTEPVEPIEVGYAFGGWYKDTACTKAWNFETDIVTGNTILYAKWTFIPVVLLAPTDLVWDGTTAKWRAVESASGYMVQLYKNGVAQGDAVTVTDAVTYDFSVSESGSYIFKVKALGDGVISLDSAEAESPALNFYTVTYVDDGKIIETQSVKHGSDAKAPAVPEKEGYTSAWDHDGKNITSDTTIMAVYTIKTYTVTYVAEGKTVETQSVKHGSDAKAPVIPQKMGYTAAWDKDGKNITADTIINAVYTEIPSEPLYRLHNPYTNEVLLLTNAKEYKSLITVGWLDMGKAWDAAVEGDPIYRLYNPYDDFHFYTKDWNEVQSLLPLGWLLDGRLSYDAGFDGKPIYRLFNPTAKASYHRYATEQSEIDTLISSGWYIEGIAWYAVK